MIHFDAAAHRYTDDAGVVFASVTEVIGAAGLYGDTRHYDDYSRDRGTAVHEAVRLYWKGTLDPVSLAPEIEPYLDAWVAFCRDAKFTPSLMEHRMADPLIQVAGTADIIGCYEGHAAILDIKTGGLVPATGIQLAGYEYLYWSDPRHDGKPARRIAVHLTAAGKYSLKEYKDRHDRETFLAAVRLFNWKKENLKGGDSRP